MFSSLINAAVTTVVVSPIGTLVYTVIFSSAYANDESIMVAAMTNDLSMIRIYPSDEVWFGVYAAIELVFFIDSAKGILLCDTQFF